MKPPLLLILVGMPGAGKSSCVKYLNDQGYPSIYFGGITIDEVRRRGLAVNEKNEKIVREEIRAVEGKEAYAKRVTKKIEELASQGKDRIVVDGLYTWTEYKFFKERFGDQAVMVAITAPRKVRHERLVHRPVRPLTEKEVTAREYAEIEKMEKGGPIANADFTLANSKNTESLFAELDALLVEIGFTTQ